MKNKIGVSSCLLGCRVRYNGADKYDPLIAALKERFELVSICPEVGCGMGVPREPMSLVEGRLITNRSGRDLTALLMEWTGTELENLQSENLRLFIFKSKSPSCGAEGIFRREFRRKFPRCRVVDEVEFNLRHYEIINELFHQ